MGKKVEDEVKTDPGGKQTPHVDLVDRKLDRLMKSHSGAQYMAVRKCMMHLAINH